MKQALFPGSFDPATLGHLDLIQRAAHLFDHVSVAVAHHSGKQTLFSAEQRVQMLKEITADIANVQVIEIEGLVVDFAQLNGFSYIIRGLRAISDCDGEFRMASANRAMGGVETLFLLSATELSHVNSTLIREIAHSGKYLDRFIPAPLVDKVYAAVQRKIQ